jgi:hypothetical protein
MHGMPLSHTTRRGFSEWLQCYGKGSQRKDSNGRTVWYFSGKRKRASSSNKVMPRDYGTMRIDKAPAVERKSKPKSRRTTSKSNAKTNSSKQITATPRKSARRAPRRRSSSAPKVKEEKDSVVDAVATVPGKRARRTRTPYNAHH